MTSTNSITTSDSQLKNETSPDAGDLNAHNIKFHHDAPPLRLEDLKDLPFLPYDWEHSMISLSNQKSEEKKIIL